MSALSNELFFEAHRGISGPIRKNRGLGTHFSADKDTATTMAQMNKEPEDFYYHPEHTTVIHADIPMSSVETSKHALMRSDVWDIDNLNKNREKEVTVKEGAKVRVKGISTRKAPAPYDLDTGERNPKFKQPRTRTRTYNPPREMKA